jgi:23S rRNA pseudouridine2605 synthase
MVRINKFLAQCNLGSRRQVESLITSGEIKINSRISKDLSVQVDPENDVVEFEGRTLNSNKDNFYIMLNKPIKYITTSKDEFDRKTVYELIPDFGIHMFSVGRLDFMSEGLLIFTSDGDFADKIIHPRYKLPKVYKVTVKGNIDEDQIKKLRDGVKIEGKMTAPAVVHVKKSNINTTVLKMTIFEGRKRQIRKMIKSVDSEVMELKRLQIGEVQLGKLPKGMWRPLKAWEVMSLINQSRKQGK